MTLTPGKLIFYVGLAYVFHYMGTDPFEAVCVSVIIYALNEWQRGNPEKFATFGDLLETIKHKRKRKARRRARAT